MTALEFWNSFFGWLKAVEIRLTATWPPELPPESSPGFWQAAARAEFQTRGALSAKVQALVVGAEFPAMTPLEAWLYRRRVDFAVQFVRAKMISGVFPTDPLNEVLLWSLLTLWETDGCIAFWNHCERGGKPPPTTPPRNSPP